MFLPINRIMVWLCILCQATATMSVDHHIMNVYHQIHHIELSHGTHPDNSVLLDLTRRRLSKHLGIDYEDLQLPIVDKNDAMPVVEELEKIHIPISNGNGIHPYSIDSEIDSEIDSITDFAVVDSSVNYPSLRSNLDARNLAKEKFDISDISSQEQQAAAKKFEISRAEDSGDKEDVDVNPQVARNLAKDTFGIDEDYTLPEGEKPIAADKDDCKKLCKCMAGELLFGITKSVPYIPTFCLTNLELKIPTNLPINGVLLDVDPNNLVSSIISDEHAASIHMDSLRSMLRYTKELREWKKLRKDCHDDGNLVFEAKLAPDSEPIWYKRNIVKGEWEWNGLDPKDSSNDKWQSVTEVESGYWRHNDWIGSKIPDENKFLIKLLDDFNPDDDGSSNGWTVPEGSDASVRDPKEDLRACAARKGKSPSEACKCKESTCLRDVVTRYFKFVQVSEKAVKDRKKQKEFILDMVQMGVGLLGMIDPFGLLADLLNAGISAARGAILDAIMDVVVALPAIGTALLPVRWVDKIKDTLKMKFILDWATKAKKGFTR